jgi:hypothetical protein
VACTISVQFFFEHAQFERTVLAAALGQHFTRPMHAALWLDTIILSLSIAFCGAETPAQCPAAPGQQLMSIVYQFFLSPL